MLLLILMTGQATGAFSALPTEAQCVQDADEKSDGETKEGKKDVKECTLSQFANHFNMGRKAGYGLAPAATPISRALEHLTPPPDVAVLS